MALLLLSIFLLLLIAIGRAISDWIHFFLSQPTSSWFVFFPIKLTARELKYISSNKNYYTFSWFRRHSRYHKTFHADLLRLKPFLENWIIPIMRFFQCYCFQLEISTFPTSYWARETTRPADNFSIPTDIGYGKIHPEDIGVNLINHPRYMNSNSEIIREPRVTEDGWLIEEARTNLLSHSFHR